MPLLLLGVGAVGGYVIGGGVDGASRMMKYAVIGGAGFGAYLLYKRYAK